MKMTTMKISLPHHIEKGAGGDDWVSWVSVGRSANYYYYYYHFFFFFLFERSHCCYFKPCLMKHIPSCIGGGVYIIVLLSLWPSPRVMFLLPIPSFFGVLGVIFFFFFFFAA